MPLSQLVGKAEILMEALPYIRRFYNKVFVIKYGGHAMIDEDLKESFARDIVLLKYIGINPVIVHGGGPQIEEIIKKLGKESRFIDGLRVTDAETMAIVEMVLVGQVNQEIVLAVNRQGGRAVGLSGKDGQLLRARKMLYRTRGGANPGTEVDLGLVGEVAEVNPGVIDSLDQSNWIPVIAPVAADEAGHTYNLNADLVAGKVAEALKAEKLILLTDVEGVKDKSGQLLVSLARDESREKIKAGVISGGMIPKVNCCLEALAGGVAKTHIIDGRVKHALLLEVFTDQGVGTQIF